MTACVETHACASVSSCVDRREFVQRLAAFAVLSSVPGCASVVAVPVRPEGGRVVLRFLHYPALLERGGHLKVRPEGSNDSIYVLALEEGGFAALSPICTHQACTVDIAGDRLICPCHGSTYDREGKVLRGPAPEPLRQYVTARTDEALIIELGAAR